MSPKMAGEIRVVQTPGSHPKLFIDGQEFPWFVEEHPYVKSFNRNEAPGITLTIPCDKLTVDLDPFGSAPPTPAKKSQRRWPWSLTDRTTG